MGQAITTISADVEKRLIKIYSSLEEFKDYSITSVEPPTNERMIIILKGFVKSSNIPITIYEYRSSFGMKLEIKEFKHRYATTLFDIRIIFSNSYYICRREKTLQDRLLSNPTISKPELDFIVLGIYQAIYLLISRKISDIYVYPDNIVYNYKKRYLALRYYRGRIPHEKTTVWDFRGADINKPIRASIFNFGLIIYILNSLSTNSKLITKVFETSENLKSEIYSIVNIIKSKLSEPIFKFIYNLVSIKTNTGFNRNISKDPWLVKIFDNRANAPYINESYTAVENINISITEPIVDKEIIESKGYKIIKEHKGDRGHSIFEVVNKSGETLIVKRSTPMDIYDFSFTLAEAKYHATLKHKRIVKFIKSFRVKNTIYITMEYLRGYELGIFLNINGRYEESRAKILFRNLLSGIEYMHSRGIVHGDINEANLVFRSKNDDVDIVYIDFERINIVNDCLVQHGLVYIYPEFYESFTEEEREDPPISAPLGCHLATKATDVWQLGMILFRILAGLNAFFSRTDPEGFPESVRLGKIANPNIFNEIVSTKAKDLVMRMLDPNPVTRIKIARIKNHPWVKIVDKASVITSSFKDIISDAIIKVPDKNLRRMYQIRYRKLRTLSPIPNASPKQIMYISVSSIISTRKQGSIKAVNKLRNVYDVYMINPRLGTTDVGSDRISETINWIKKYFPGKFYTKLIVSHNLSLLKGQWIVIESAKYNAKYFGDSFPKDEILPGKVYLFKDWKTTLQHFLQ